MKVLIKLLFLWFLLLSTQVNSYGQQKYVSYNVDSLLKKLSANTELDGLIKQAAHIYKHAGISSNNISLNAFKVAYLEKCFLDAGRIAVQLPKDSTSLPYTNRNILTVIDFTKNGKQKRFITVDLVRQRILHNTQVAHGSAMGKGLDTLVHEFGWSKDAVNNKYEVPLFFGNADGSYRSSLGLVLAIKGDQPDNLCHLCKHFISKPHKDVVLLAGLESGINDNDIDREIVIHTTGSKDFSDSSSIKKIAAIIAKDSIDYNGLGKRNCNCIAGSNSVSAYASACGIADNKGFIGRSAGCFVLPEETHMPVMKTVQDGSLIFVYSNAIAPTSTNYFEESAIIKKIVSFAEGRK